MLQADVVVIGGGPAGCAAAIALSGEGRSSAVLEFSNYDRNRFGEILPPAVKLPLCALGVWDRFCGHRFAPSPGIISAWGGELLYANDFVLSPYGHGWHVLRSRFDRMLAEAAEERGAALHTGARVVDCRRTDNGWQIQAQVGGASLSLRAGFVIDATGRASWFARRLGHHRIVYDRLVGIVGHIDRFHPDAVRERRALIESCPDGWWYSAELPGNRCVAAYMTDADLIARTHQGPRAHWRKRGNTPFTDGFIGAATDTVDIRVATASTSNLSTVTDGESWLAVGDAAIACDPLWGQGVVAALKSGLAAAGLLTDPAALARHNAAVARRFDDYRRLQAHYYRRETRWPDSVFWTRRQHDPRQVHARTP